MERKERETPQINSYNPINPSGYGKTEKQTVDYFPHFVKGGRTIFILENKFGNDGYAFWFKLLEILGESEGHFYDCSNASNWEYLLAKTRVTEERRKTLSTS